MGRIKKAIIDAITKKTIRNANAHIDAWKKAGISSDLINEFIDRVKDIEGVTVDSKGRIKADNSLDVYSIGSIKQTLPTMKELKKNLKESEMKLTEINIANDKERNKVLAELTFRNIVRKYKNDAMKDLWDLWYDDHNVAKDKRVKNEKIFGLREDVESDLADELKTLGEAIKDGRASAEDIQIFVQKINDALGENES